MNVGDFQCDVRVRTVPNLLRFAWAKHGHKQFLRETGNRQWLSVAESISTSRRLASGLSKRGVAKHDFVPLMLPNCAEFVLAWFALNLRGAAYISINTSLKGDLLAAQLTLMPSRLWIAHSEFLPVLEDLSSDLRSSVETLVVVGDRSSAKTDRWREIITFDQLPDLEDGSDAVVEVDFSDVAAVTFTSGTTGISKGVAVTHGQAVSCALTFAEVVSLEPADIIYTPLPLFHGMSSWMGMLPALLYGARIVLGKRFSGSRFWNDVIEAHATIAQVIFSITRVLLAQPASPLDRAHGVTRMFNAHNSEAFERRFGAKLVEAFGMSEVGLSIASPYAEQRSGSAGRPHREWEIALLDDHGLPVPVGTPGEIVCRPKLPGIMMRGYLGQPHRTVEATKDLWFHTGDIARQDADGYYWFIDRVKERIRRRGENISSMEIEECVRQHPAVTDVAAVAYPARDGEDDIRLLIVTREGHAVDPATLHEWLSGRLPRHMVPRYIEGIEALPYTATNKVEKSRLISMGLSSRTWDAETNRVAPNLLRA